MHACGTRSRRDIGGCSLWLDRVYLRTVYLDIALKPPPQQYTTLAALPRMPGLLHGTARRFITRSTFQGDGQTATVGIWADENTYIESAARPYLPSPIVPTPVPHTQVLR